MITIMKETNKLQASGNMWNERYSSPEFAFGTEPNQFFKEQLDKLQPGNLLLPADGEGRNAVYAAKKGWKVTAFDLSYEAKNKAMKLAEIKQVSIDYLVSDIENIKFPELYYDAIALVYIHFTVEKREAYHKKLIKWLKPGGIIIIECFSKEQLRYNSGGPKDESMLLSKELVAKDFSELEILKLDQEIIFLQEGKYHQGEGSVVRLVAKKIN
jgi:SAM-dependent methyltransferase